MLLALHYQINASQNPNNFHFSSKINPSEQTLMVSILSHRFQNFQTPHREDIQHQIFRNQYSETNNFFQSFHFNKVRLYKAVIKLPASGLREQTMSKYIGAYFASVSLSLYQRIMFSMCIMCVENCCLSLSRTMNQKNRWKQFR